MSLSLLKRLTREEADSILTHEMAHFSGGDTLFSKKISPLLTRYGLYLEALAQSFLALPIAFFMASYRRLFELSLRRTSRAREMRADSLGAEVTTPDAMARALIKVSAYSSYRARVEELLFSRKQAHSSLNIATDIASGFSDYARGPRLASDMDADAFPHPFDSHPTLQERLANVGVSITPEQVPDIVVETSAQTWFSDVADGDAIEAELWQSYEQQFKEAHARSLAYRYLPSTPEERAHVERYFPPTSIPMKDGLQLRLDCEMLEFSEWNAQVRWEDITGMRVEDAFLGRVLILDVATLRGRDKHKVPLRKAVDNNALLAAVQAYYTRAMAAKEHAKGN